MSASITVLMSVYNGARWLEESISSVLVQTLCDFEFVIVNDGSTDASIKIVRRFARQDARIKLIDKTNSGLADSLNRGISQARGRWIARIDADDVCEPDRLVNQLRLASSDSSLVLVGTGLRVVDEHGVTVSTHRYPRDHAPLLRRLITGGAFFAHSSAFFLTEAATTLGGYRTRIKRAEDLDLWLRLSEIGKMACIEEPKVRIRVHSAQISHDEGGRRQRIDSRTAIVSYFLRRLGLPDPVDGTFSDCEFDEFRAWLVVRLEHDNLFDYCDFVQRCKGRPAPNRGQVHAFLNLFRIASAHPLFAVRYARQKALGDNLAHRLAVEWAEARRKCAE